MNESDKYETMSDDKMTALFQRAIEVEDERAMALGYSVQRMDENHEPYLLYPDGHRKYYDDNKDQFFIVYPNGKKEYIND
ncbi:MAG: hypothetical protein SPL25_10760 [Succinivibrionaceae bacterium]|jgi:hypothetical protein|nr:hypothetical protein [Succinivibrionaceae bacterium]